MYLVLLLSLVEKHKYKLLFVFVNTVMSKRHVQRSGDLIHSKSREQKFANNRVVPQLFRLKIIAELTFVDEKVRPTK